MASTYLGGSDNDGINAALINNYGDAARGEVNLDENGNILIASYAYSTGFPETVNQSDELGHFIGLSGISVR